MRVIKSLERNSETASSPRQASRKIEIVKCWDLGEKNVRYRPITEKTPKQSVSHCKGRQYSAKVRFIYTSINKRTIGHGATKNESGEIFIKTIRYPLMSFEQDAMPH
jgi:hypothetical protein